mmetsp:Transcript_10607/g.26762  ORF Transcript_10607/g.26762 Transcript_10607/m.26762 type:complete len:204 (-) Transcript_10607:108-719(-)
MFDSSGMLINHMLHLASFHIPHSDQARFITREDGLVQRSPMGTQDLIFSFLHFQNFHRLCFELGEITIEFVDENGGHLSEDIIRNSEEHLLAFSMLNKTHRNLCIPGEELTAGLQLPKLHKVVSRRREEAFAVAARVHGPNSTLVATVGSKSDTITAVPKSDGWTLTGGEEEVTVVVECDRSDGTIMALQHVNPHDGMCIDRS